MSTREDLGALFSSLGSFATRRTVSAWSPSPVPLHSGWFVAWGFDEPLLAFSIKKEELDGELEAPRQYRRKEASNHRSTIGCAGSSGCGKDGDCRFDHETGGDSSGTSCHRHPDAWVSA